MPLLVFWASGLVDARKTCGKHGFCGEDIVWRLWSQLVMGLMLVPPGVVIERDFLKVRVIKVSDDFIRVDPNDTRSMLGASSYLFI